MAFLGSTIQQMAANKLSKPYYRFDGVNDVITVTTPALPTGNESRSMTLWVKTTDGTSIIMLAGYGNDASTQMFCIGLSSGTVKFYSYGDDLIGTVAINDDVWHHIVITHNESDGVRNLYVDGVFDVTDTGTLTTASGKDFLIGKYPDNSVFAEIETSGCQVWNTALSATEVKESYSGASVPFKYKGASGTDFASGWSFSSGWAIYTGTINDADTFTTTGAGGAYHNTLFSNTVGKRYRYHVVGTTTASSLNFYPGSSGGLMHTQGTGAFDVTFEFTHIVGSQGGFYARNGVAGETTITTLTITQIGAVAEYDGSSMNSTHWRDKSGNALHGTVTGATIENQANQLHIKGHHSPVAMAILESTSAARMHLWSSSAESSGFEFKHGSSHIYTLESKGNDSTFRLRRGSDDADIWKADQSLNTTFGGDLTVTGSSTVATVHVGADINLSSTGASQHITRYPIVSGWEPLIIRFKNASAANAAGIKFQTANASAAYTDRFVINSDSNTPHLYMQTNGGNVGIGTASPTQALELAGDMRIQDARSLFFKRHGDNYAWRIRNESASDGSTYGFNGSNDLVFEVVSNSQTQATPAVESHTVYSTSANTLVLQEAGQVGIKVADPQYTLDVGGAINSTSSLRIKSANNSHAIMNLGYTTADNAYQDINWTHQSSATEVGVKLRFYQRPNGGELQIHTGRDGTLATAVTIGTLGSQNCTFAGTILVNGTSTSEFKGMLKAGRGFTAGQAVDIEGDTFGRTNNSSVALGYRQDGSGDLFLLEKADGGDIFKVTNDGSTTIAGDISMTGDGKKMILANGYNTVSSMLRISNRSSITPSWSDANIIEIHGSGSGSDSEVLLYLKQWENDASRPIIQGHNSSGKVFEVGSNSEIINRVPTNGTGIIRMSGATDDSEGFFIRHTHVGGSGSAAGSFQIVRRWGGSDPGTAGYAMQITGGGATTFSGTLGVTGNATFSADANIQQLTLAGNGYMSDYMYHLGNTGTYMRFETGQVTLASSSGPNISLNNDGNTYIGGGNTIINGDLTAEKITVHNRGPSFSSSTWRGDNHTESWDMSDMDIGDHFFGTITVYIYHTSEAMTFSINQHTNTFAARVMSRTSDNTWWPVIHDLGTTNWTTGDNTTNGEDGYHNIGISRSNTSGGAKFFWSNRSASSKLLHVWFNVVD